MTENSDLEMVVAACEALLQGDMDQPDGYPDSPAPCINDVIWSIGVRPAGVKNVVTS